jgi:SAM-dependent methyltransferase
MTSSPRAPALPRFATAADPALRIRFPKTSADRLGQDQEWCEIAVGAGWQRIRFHDYAEIYSRPGLYEQLFCSRLECTSPQRVVDLFEQVLLDFPDDAADLRVLELGAGNGMVGERLRALGVGSIVGVDIIPEACVAAERDRPGVYDHYIVGDMTALATADRRRLESAAPNTLCVVAALGFGDIPAAAFLAACETISVGGWLVFNIKEQFLRNETDPSGFAGLIQRLQRERKIQIQALRRYRHRLSVHGDPLHYVAIVATKEAPLSAAPGD